MAQDTSGTNLETTATATSRVPTFSFKVDWAGDGWGSTGKWTFETDYVIAMRGDMQGTNYAHSIAVVGKAVADVVYVTCQNPEASGSYSGLRFSQTNASGPLYDYIKDGKIYMTRALVRMGFEDSGTPERLTQIRGYIIDAREDYSGRTITVQIRDRGAMLATTKSSSALYEDTGAKTYLQALCALPDLDPIAAGNQQLDQGMVVVPYMWMDNETIWEEMSILAEAQLGWVWLDKDGNLHFDDGTRFVSPDDNAWDDATVTQATLTVTSFRDCSPRIDVANVYNEIIVEYSPYYLGQEQVVYSESDTLKILPFAFAADPRGGHLLIHDVGFQYPVSSLSTIASGDYVAVTAGGTDMTSDVTLSWNEENATKGTLYIYNANTEFSAFIVKLEMRGIPLLSGNTAKYECEDAASIAQFGRKAWTVRNPYIQTRRHAEMIGDFLLSRYKEPVNHLIVRGMPALPWLEVGDLVRVREDLTGINLKCFIGRIEWAFSARNPKYTQTIHVMPRGDIFPYTGYFILGTSRYGAGTDRGRLFW